MGYFLKKLYPIFDEGSLGLMMKVNLAYFKKIFAIAVLALGVSVFSVAGAWAANVIKDVRIGQQNDGIRIVLDGAEKFDYDAFLLSSPNRLVIDVKNASLPTTPKVTPNKIISGFRVGDLANVKGKRLVFTLNSDVNIKKKFAIEPNAAQKNWRLVLDVSTQGFNLPSGNVSTKATTTNNARRQKIVVLDPGHGGKDPGAIGRSFKTYEKNITLSMGQELKKQLESKGFKVYMTRSTDIFIPLRKRVDIARSYHADLFISLHADSTVNRKAQGLSIYTLSENASDKEAAALAERENKADIIDGMDFSDNSPEINDVLISLSQNDSRNKSSKFAGYVVDDIKKQVTLVSNAHKFAGFAVLKAPDIPSVLLEMGYLSNYTEEKYLRQPNYRKKIAESITRAVVKYFKDPEIASSI